MPPLWRAYSQLKMKVRALPTWRNPVGDGAKRTRSIILEYSETVGSPAETLAVVVSGEMREVRRAQLPGQGDTTLEGGNGFLQGLGNFLGIGVGWEAGGLSDAHSDGFGGGEFFAGLLALEQTVDPHGEDGDA